MHFYTHPHCFNHTPPPDPDFAPKRLRTVIEALRDPRFSRLAWHEPQALMPQELELVHTKNYIAKVLATVAVNEKRFLAPDTVAVAGTASAALAAAGVVMAATKDVIAKNADRAFCIVSPGGHHAEADAAGGFCFFNNVALAAVAAQKNFGLSRVAVLDFDAHHGNGTQSFFWNFEDRLYISLHEETGLSGFAGETGAYDNVLNIPLPGKTGGDDFRKAFEEKALPKLDAFKPDVVFVSAGFDMHIGDPLSSMRLNGGDYFRLGQTLRAAADSLCKGRLVAVLEGGYNLDALGSCAASFVDGLENIGHAS